MVLVFDFSACPSISHDRFEGGICNFKIGGEGILVELFSRIFAGDGHFAPVHDQGICFPGQWKLIGMAIGGDFRIFPHPTPNDLAA